MAVAFVTKRTWLCAGALWMGVCCSTGREANELSVRQGCRLSRKLKGPDVSVTEGGLGVAGTGAVLCSAPIIQSKSQFEVKVVKKGPLCIGIAGADVDFAKPLAYQTNSWVLDLTENKVIFGDEESVPVEERVEVAIGDVLGCTFDQDNGMISFYLNGRPLAFSSPLALRKLRGSIHPAISQVETIFETADFSYSCEDKGYVGVMIARSLI